VTAEHGRPKRKLVAVFAADAAGYSRLMNADEAATFRLLTADRDIAARLIAQHEGRIANTAGDSILAEFPSTIDALKCSLDIQERIGALNENVSEERRIHFRIGLHVGEVVVSGGDMFGDAVNVAARMQTLAAPGSVCLSEAAHQIVSRNVSIPFEELGPQQVKNLGPTRAYLARPSVEGVTAAIPSVHRAVEAYLARRFYQLCAGALRTITEPEGIEPSSLGPLGALNDLPEADERHLAKRLGLPLKDCIRLLRRLQAKGLVERRKHERRAVLAITDEGRRLFFTLHPRSIAALDRVLAALSESERETLRFLLARVIQANETAVYEEPGWDIGRRVGDAVVARAPDDPEL
jgi:adenylate cyclase